MILLHGALVEDRFQVWGESDQELTPRALSAALSEAVPGLALGEAKPEHLTAWLPSAERRPLPSSPLLEAAPPASRQKPRLAPWDV